MNKEDKLILGTLAGLDLVLSPEHYEEYKGTLNKQLEEKDKEIDRLNNIINYIWQVFENGGFEDGCNCIKIYDYLKELKECDKE